MSKLSMEAFLEINYEVGFQRNQGHIFHNMTYDISKYKFQNGLE